MVISSPMFTRIRFGYEEPEFHVCLGRLQTGLSRNTRNLSTLWGSGANVGGSTYEEVFCKPEISGRETENAGQFPRFTFRTLRMRMGEAETDQFATPLTSSTTNCSENPESGFCRRISQLRSGDTTRKPLDRVGSDYSGKEDMTRITSILPI